MTGQQNSPQGKNDFSQGKNDFSQGKNDGGPESAESQKRPVPTLMHVAKLAGVSRSTASAALNGKGKFTEQTRRAVLDAARTLGYRPHPIGRTLRVGGSPPLLIGLVMDRGMTSENRLISQHLDARVLWTMCEVLSDHGYGLVVISGETGADIPEFPFDAVGIFSNSQDFQIPSFIPQHVPVLAIGHQRTEERITALVDHDHEAMTREVMDHLLQAGAKKIALVSRPGRFTYVNEITHAYQRWCEDHGLKPVIIDNDGTAEGVRAAIAAATRDGVDAFYTLAGEPHSTLRAVADAGRKVPDDVLVAALVEPVTGEVAVPPTTTMSMCADSSAQIAANALIDLAMGVPPRELELPHLLTIRESTTRS